jgi:hypothetical protein
MLHFPKAFHCSNVEDTTQIAEIAYVKATDAHGKQNIMLYAVVGFLIIHQT